MTEANPQQAPEVGADDEQAHAQESEAVRIDIVSDVVCPWCYIGKRQLDDALARWRERHADAPAPTIAWHPFQLNPTMPREGMARSDYLKAKFGDPNGGPGYNRVRNAASTAGLIFHPERIVRQPNTLRAHALIGAAAGPLQHTLAARLFECYFVEGKDIGDEATLRAAAAEVGVPAEAVDAAMRPDALEATETIDSGLREAGIGGVPYFVIGQRINVSGAQGTDRLLEAIELCTPG